MVDDSIFAGPARPIGGGSDDDSIFAGPARPIGSAEEKPSLLNTPSVSKSFIEGAGEGILGAAELIPGTIHNKAVEWEGKLHEDAKAHPWAESAGQIAPLFVPGAEATGALLPAKAIRAGEGIFDWGKGLIGNMARGSVKGAAGGVAAGALAPTGKEDYGESLKEKEKAAEVYGETGAALGPVVGAVRPIVSGVKKVIPMITGSTTKGQSEALVGKLGAKTAEEAAKAAETNEEALKRAAQINTDFSTQTAEMNRIVKEQQDIAFALRGASPGDEAAIKAQVAEELRLRTIDAQKASQEAGLSSHDARAFVIEQEIKTTEAEKAAQSLSESLNKGEAIDATTLGTRIRDTAQNLYDRLSKERETRAGFGQAVDSAGDELRVPTDRAVKYIDGLSKYVGSPDTERVLSVIKSRLQTGEGAEAVNKLNLRKADSVRKYINEILRSRENAIQVSGTAVGKEARIYLAEVKKLVEEESRKAWQPYNKAMDTFAALSKPLKYFKPKTPLAGAIATDEAGEYKLLEGQITANLLQKTGKGSEALARLLQDNPSLKEDMRAYFQHQLSGSEGLSKSITPDRIEAFMRKNETALRQTGLYEDFYNSYKHLSQAHFTLGKIKDLQNQFKLAVKEGEVSADMNKKMTLLNESLTRANLNKDELANRIETVFKQLSSENKISIDELKLGLSEVDKLRTSIANERIARKVAAGAISAALIAYFGYPALRDFHITTHLL